MWFSCWVHMFTPHCFALLQLNHLTVFMQSSRLFYSGPISSFLSTTCLHFFNVLDLLNAPSIIKLTALGVLSSVPSIPLIFSLYLCISYSCCLSFPKLDHMSPILLYSKHVPIATQLKDFSTTALIFICPEASWPHNSHPYSLMLHV